LIAREARGRIVKTLVPAAALLLLAGALVALAEERTVIAVEGDKAPRVKEGDVVRFTLSGAAGRSKLTASVEGDAKLVATATVRKFKDGKPLLGAVTKEFEVKAEKKGRAVVKLTAEDTVDKISKTKEYTLDIE
jgi:hypothetical protein